MCNYKALKQREIAELFEVSDRMVRKWTSEGAPRNGDGTYNLTQVLHWRMARHHSPPGHVLYHYFDDDELSAETQGPGKVSTTGSLRAACNGSPSKDPETVNDRR
jgi:hypothetical protein